MTRQRKDQGYTLVEMIIVIAIIAIVAGLALISVTLIHSARAKEAAVTVDSEVATLITKSKNMQAEEPGKLYAARIYADSDEKYYFQRGYYDPSTHKYDFSKETEGEGKGISLTSYVIVKYTGEETIVQSGFQEDTMGVSTAVTDHDLKDLNFHQGLFIRFNKDGTCAEGVGDIRFYKRNGNMVAHEYIRANGSHQSR